MGSLKLPHASGNSMSIGAPATNPSGDLELKLPATIGSAGQVLKNSDTAGTLEFGPAPRPYRNLIINGALQCNQYGSSSSSSGYKTVDRWQMNAGGANAALTQTQHALTSSDTGPWEKGFRNSYHILNAGQSGPDAGDYLELYQYIEAQNISQSGWNYASSSSKLTISFWVKSSVAQKFYGFLYTKQGGSIRKMYSFEVSNGGSNLTADTWTKITHTIPGDSSLAFDNDNTLGLGVGIFPFQGTDLTTSGHSLNTWAAFNAANKLPDYTSTWWTTSNATFEFTGVQLEVGVATEFEMRSYADELARCQRYYETHNHLTTAKTTDGDVTSYWSTITSNDSNTLVVSTGIIYKVPKRASPTVTIYNSSDTSTAARVNAQGTERTVNATYGGPHALTRIYVLGASAGNYVTYNWEASAEL